MSASAGNTVDGPVPFAKGHGTENDFVIVPDPDGVLEIPPQLVRVLCDRRAGIGADGLLRVVRTTRIPEGLGLDGDWFMDYRNGDGSIAEMCGNGIRVFARYLVEAGLAKPGTMRIATRAGTKLVVVPDGESDITVDMGPAVIGSEAVVQVGGRQFAGISVSMGNPHLVCGTALPVEHIDLSSAPEFDPSTFPAGVNVEVVNVLAGDARVAPGTPAPEGYDLRVRMRVYERGSGETRSCGTGACAVGAVALRSAGKATGRVAVEVPGGRVAVTVTTATTLLEGPAVLVAGGHLSPEWLARASSAEAVEPEQPRTVLGEVVTATPGGVWNTSSTAPPAAPDTRPGAAPGAPPAARPGSPAARPEDAAARPEGAAARAEGATAWPGSPVARAEGAAARPESGPAAEAPVRAWNGAEHAAGRSGAASTSAPAGSPAGGAPGEWDNAVAALQPDAWNATPDRPTTSPDPSAPADAPPDRAAAHAAAAGDRASTAGDRGAAPGDWAAAPTDRPAASGDRASAPGEWAAVPTDRAVASGDFAAGPSDRSAAPGDRSAAPGDWAAAQADWVAAQADRASGLVDRASAPADGPLVGRPSGAPERSATMLRGGAKRLARPVPPDGPVPSAEPVAPTGPPMAGRSTIGRPTSARRASALPTPDPNPNPAPEPTASAPAASGAGASGSGGGVTPGLGALLAAVTAPVIEEIAEESADEQPGSGQHPGARPNVRGRPAPADRPGHPLNPQSPLNRAAAARSQAAQSPAAQSSGAQSPAAHPQAAQPQHAESPPSAPGAAGEPAAVGPRA